MGQINLINQSVFATLFTVLVSNTASAQTQTATDLMNLAQGVLPVGITAGAEEMRITQEHVISAIDGNPKRYVAMGKPAAAGQFVEFLYALPAGTIFSAFSVPNVKETPSPSQTFFKLIEVLGSSQGPDGPFAVLARAEVAASASKGEVTQLQMAPDQAKVGWIKLRLADGVDVQRYQTFLEFSELSGHGVQDEPDLSTGFSGVWRGRGVKLELEQEGATVTGCYDGNAMLSGTVHGNVLRALGQNDAGISSQFILVAAGDGSLRGLRSTNGAPFKPYNGDASDATASCLEPEPPKLGCGSVLHGIQFDFDSDVIRPSSQVLLADLYNGLSDAGAASVQIVGHSSSEGADDYNRDLSERRAGSVVAALVALGMDGSVMSAVGRGEDEPIASNEDEAGRSLNRRVEVRCSS
ncbi:MAG: OmpA family protein [Pseudomonadota bacterium]